MGTMSFTYAAAELESKAVQFAELCEDLELQQAAKREFFPQYEAMLIDLEAQVKKVGILFRAKLREWS